MMLGQEHSESRSIVLNIVTLLMVVSIGFLLKQEATQLDQTNKSHAAVLVNLRNKFLNLESQFVNSTIKFGQFDKVIVSTIAAEQLKIEKMVRLLQQKMRVHFERPQYDRPFTELPYEQRLARLERFTAEHSVLIDLIENQMKQTIKEERAKKFKEIATKSDYFGNTRRKNFWMMEQANLKTTFTSDYQLRKMQQNFRKEEERLQSAYHINGYKTELPFCIIIPTYNNAKHFRFQFNIQSILNQHYNNYHVIIVDDASTDHTGWLIERFLRKNGVSEDRVKVVTNRKRVTAVPNIHYAIMNHCRSNQIGFFIDGDDELLSRKVFQVYNAVYQEKKPAIAYSIALEYWMMDDLVKDGWSMPYTYEQKANNLYRDVPQKISHLRSFRIDLYRQIKQRDLKDQNGEWFTSTYDEVICLPMLEMSCGNIEFINEYLYLYSYGTGLNDRQVDEHLQWNIAQYVKFKMPKYQCSTKFGTPLPKLNSGTLSKITYKSPQDPALQTEKPQDSNNDPAKVKTNEKAQQGVKDSNAQKPIK